MTLRQAHDGAEYIIQKVAIQDEELNSFLFSLGCYSGEVITMVRRLTGGCIVKIKNGRYHIDNQLAETIIV